MFFRHELFILGTAVWLKAKINQMIGSERYLILNVSLNLDGILLTLL